MIPMQRTVLKRKAVLHIPQMAWENGELVDIDLAGALEELLENLAEAGVTSLYQTQATGYYKGRSYPEMLFTVFGIAETTAAVHIFEAWNKKHKGILKQEAFAYELDERLFVYQY